MNRARIADLPWQEQRSPSGKFHSFSRNLSVALGCNRNVGTWGGGHPFDLAIRRLPSGASVCPFHLHLAQWEFFIVLTGDGSVRTNEARTAIKTGDVFFHPPGAAHQIMNTGDSDLEVLIIADNPPLDGCYYPDSDKWALRPPMKVFRLNEVDYFDGEDDTPATASSYRPPPAASSESIVPFAQRKLNVDAIAWELFESPKKKFRGWSRELSIGLGAKRNTPSGLGGHPFDVELQKLAPREAGCPFHWHANQWELYYIVSGAAAMRTAEGVATAEAGEILLHPPFDPHQIRNASTTDDLLFYLVADNPSADYWHYPDSGKYGLREPRKFFRLAEADYWDGEE